VNLTGLTQGDSVLFDFLNLQSNGQDSSRDTDCSIKIGGSSYCRGSDGVAQRVDVLDEQTSLSVQVINSATNEGVSSAKIYYTGKVTAIPE